LRDYPIEPPPRSPHFSEIPPYQIKFCISPALKNKIRKKESTTKQLTTNTILTQTKLINQSLYKESTMLQNKFVIII
jgi:hypothetical protein